MIKKILIANRGEIAVRIIRTCKEMNIKTVAVYSVCDKTSLHTQIADEAICIGNNKASESYLKMDAIIQAALNSGCDAIHPGFGFLSENSDFARLVSECGLIWIGPSANLIELLGNKSQARKIVGDIGVPIIPGSKTIIQDLNQAKQVAKDIGLPVIVKASNGGGGKGMRVIENLDNLEHQFKNAKSEAKACFGDDALYMEKYIKNPKHIEVQVVGDTEGNVVHFFERDCSFQRRHQKLIEEAPCHILKEDIRRRLYQDVIKICKAVNYYSLGTIEFLVDQEGNYYFMEMNTRIQVEHPITEMITGYDLVKLQIQIANGISLKIKQEDIKINGHSLECRINAEDINLDFAPSPGKISFMHLPGGRGVRIDSAMYNGYQIPPFYDSMICKVITYGSNRLECIKKMRQALSELIIDGIKTNVHFHFCVLHAKNFIDGRYDTGFYEVFMEELKANDGLV